MALRHAAPGEVVHLRPLGSALAKTRTHALVKADRFEAVRLILPAGASIPEHRVEGAITLHCLEGHAILETDREVVLAQGDWVFLERGVGHAVRAIRDSALLLTILFD